MDEHVDFFSSVLDAAPDGILIVDGEGVVTFANRQAAELFGFEHDELVGSTVDRLLPDALRDGHRVHRDRYRAEPTSRPMGVGMLLRARRADGAEVPVEVSLSPMGHGPTFAVIAVVRDVTARVEADAQLRRSSDALRAAEQTVAIADDRERIARDLHDTVIQRLFASGLALQAAMAQVDPKIAGKIDAVVADLDQTVREIRTSIFALQTSAPGETGLRLRILDIIGEATDSLGHEPRLRFEGPLDELGATVAEQLLPTLRQALIGPARREAGATVVSVVLDDGQVVLGVDDDGADDGAGASFGTEVPTMRARAQQLGGSLTVGPGAEGGWQLRWAVPIGSDTRWRRS